MVRQTLADAQPASEHRVGDAVQARSARAVQPDADRHVRRTGIRREGVFVADEQGDHVDAVAARGHRREAAVQIHRALGLLSDGHRHAQARGEQRQTVAVGQSDERKPVALLRHEVGEAEVGADRGGMRRLRAREEQTQGQCGEE